jgi:hypothetical protein
MKKISIPNRLLLFFMVLLASYAVITSGNDTNLLVTWSFTVGFGVLVIAGLLLIILGYSILQNPVVLILTTLIPLSFSLGLVALFLPDIKAGYLFFVMAGLALVIFTRLDKNKRLAAPVIAVVHGLSGLMLFGLPFYLVLNLAAGLGILWVSVGSLLIGLAGLLLTFLRVGAPLLSEDTILTIFPAVILLTTIAFTAGMGVI